MSIITIFSGTHCHGGEIARKVAEAKGLELIGDKEIAARAAKAHGVSENKIGRTLAGKVSAWNNFTHERERNISYLKLQVAEAMKGDNFILHGFCALLVPNSISHVLSVCLIAEMNNRVEVARETLGASDKDARKEIQKDDEKAAIWADLVLGKSPWDADAYDILIPTGKSGVEDAAKLIADKSDSKAVEVTEASRQAVADFQLAALVEVEMAREGHEVTVKAENGKVIVTIDKHVLMLNRLEEELKSLAKKVPGVGEVETKVGPGFYQAGVYRQLNVDMPNKVLLVDDEQEYVQTLSERLQMRDMGSAVVYDGEQALSLVKEEEPEVMVLDLKMPGIDGIEVLRRIKQEHPAIEVIVLTGHGTEKDKERCIELGAFAYLQKPVDVEKLSEIMKQAYDKIRSAGE